MARIKNNIDNNRKNTAIEYGHKMVEEGGLSNVTIRKLAGDLNCSIGTIYNIFKNNDDMILHINAATLDNIKLFIEENLNTNLNAVGTIKNLANLYALFAKENYHCWNALFEFRIPREELPEWYNEKVTNLFNLIEEPLSSVISDVTKIELVAKILWSAIHGICILGLTNKLNNTSSDSVNVMMDSLIENYIRGLQNEI